MRFALMTEPQQGLTYADLLAVARAAEDAGFEAFFRSDHYTSFPGASGRPTTDAWTTLAGLARETYRIHLGALVSPVTFRIPGSFAKVVATVQEMSGGRVEVGVGAGWNDQEHAELGIPYPDTVERVDMLEEEMQILRGLWNEPDGWSLEGEHWQVRDARFVKRPEPVPNVIVGGSGRPRSLRLGVSYADEYNFSSMAPGEVKDGIVHLADAERAAGKAEGSLTRSVMAGVLIGKDEADVRARVTRQIQAVGSGDTDPEAWMATRRPRWVIGTPDQARARVAEFAAAGAQRLMLQTLLPWDLDHIKLIGEALLR